MSRPRGHLGVQLDLGGGVTRGQMQKATRAEAGRETFWVMSRGIPSPQGNPGLRLSPLSLS